MYHEFTYTKKANKKEITNRTTFAHRILPSSNIMSAVNPQLANLATQTMLNMSQSQTNHRKQKRGTPKDKESSDSLTHQNAGTLVRNVKKWTKAQTHLDEAEAIKLDLNQIVEFANTQQFTRPFTRSPNLVVFVLQLLLQKYPALREHSESMLESLHAKIQALNQKTEQQLQKNIEKMQQHVPLKKTTVAVVKEPSEYDSMSFMDIKGLAKERGIKSTGKGRTREVLLQELKGECPPTMVATKSSTKDVISESASPPQHQIEDISSKLTETNATQVMDEYDSMSFKDIKRMAKERGIKSTGKGRTREVMLQELKGERPPTMVVSTKTDTEEAVSDSELSDVDATQIANEYDSMSFMDIKGLAKERGIKATGKGRTREVLLKELKDYDAKNAS